MKKNPLKKSKTIRKDRRFDVPNMKSASLISINVVPIQTKQEYDEALELFPCAVWIGGSSSVCYQVISASSEYIRTSCVHVCKSECVNWCACVRSCVFVCVLSRSGLAYVRIDGASRKWTHIRCLFTVNSAQYVNKICKRIQCSGHRIYKFCA